MIQRLEYLSNPAFSRVELQRMRVGICSFIDKHPDSFLNASEIDLQRLKEAGLGQTVDAVYHGDGRAILDDFRFFRFVKAGRQYRETKDDVSQGQLERNELLPYMEYSLNTPYSPEEETLMAVTGYQPLSEDMKKSLSGQLFSLFRAWPPTFSPEYRDYFMKFRAEILHPEEVDPKLSEKDRFFKGIAQDMTRFMQPPQDVIREDLAPPEKIELGRTRLDPTGEVFKGAKEVLDFLNEPQKQVMILLLGLADGKPRTYAETAKIMNITMEEVKKLEKESFRSLRKFPKD